MQIFTEVTLAEWCFPSEGLFWIAFGRPPELSLSYYRTAKGENVLVDHRVHPAMIVMGALRDYMFPRSEEIRLTGAVVDDERFANGTFYADATIKKTRKDADEAISEMERAGKNVSAYWQMSKQDDKDVEYFQSLNLSLRPILDTATAQLYLALAEGRIKGRGFRWLGDGQTSEHIVEDVDKSIWTLSYINDTSRALEESGNEFACLYISVADLLSVFPNPAGPVHSPSGEHRPLCIIKDGIPTLPLRRPKGNGGCPELGHGVLKLAALREARELKRRDAWPPKKEAQIELLMEYCREIGLPVGRTTVQTWLLELR